VMAAGEWENYDKRMEIELPNWQTRWWMKSRSVVLVKNILTSIKYVLHKSTHIVFLVFCVVKRRNLKTLNEPNCTTSGPTPSNPLGSNHQQPNDISKPHG
jgi:hypothetical protein